MRAWRDFVEPVTNMYTYCLPTEQVMCLQCHKIKCADKSFYVGEVPTQLNIATQLIVTHNQSHKTYCS